MTWKAHRGDGLFLRLLSRVRVTASGCMEWTGSRTKTGYGRVGIGTRAQGVTSAHRAAWAHWFGGIPHGLEVLHHCDNRACINVLHLFLGTQADNIADMDRKGRRRWKTARGSEATHSKLTEADVLAARAATASGEVSARELARRHGVASSTMTAAILGRTWKHLNGGSK